MDTDMPAAAADGSDPSPDPALCPCGSGAVLEVCCRPILVGSREAETAEELMRSRFTAFALRDPEHLLASWDPGYRPTRRELSASLDDDLAWRRLAILDTEAGGPGDRTGVVEFVAIARGSQGKMRMHERSRFRRIAEHPGWVYIDGRMLD
ncbi:YchJ family protein [Brachybacterium endophyticum]|nr:YchJ family metal-binding protein [Brachybacterium endophyticum]